MIIQNKLIRNPRATNRVCWKCGKNIARSCPTIRTYGAASKFDSPYVIFSHEDCKGHWH